MDLRHLKWTKKDQFKRRKTLTGPRLFFLFMFVVFFGFFLLDWHKNGPGAVSIIFTVFWLPMGLMAFFASDENCDSCTSFFQTFSGW